MNQFLAICILLALLHVGMPTTVGLQDQKTMKDITPTSVASMQEKTTESQEQSPTIEPHSVKKVVGKACDAKNPCPDGKSCNLIKHICENPGSSKETAIPYTEYIESGPPINVDIMSTSANAHHVISCSSVGGCSIRIEDKKGTILFFEEYWNLQKNWPKLDPGLYYVNVKAQYIPKKQFYLTINGHPSDNPLKDLSENGGWFSFHVGD